MGCPPVRGDNPWALAINVFLWWPPKNIHKIFIPRKHINFSENPKKYWNFEPQKIARAYVCVKISEYNPPTPLGWSYPEFQNNKSTLSSQVHNLQKLKNISLKAVNYFCTKIKSNLSEWNCLFSSSFSGVTAIFMVMCVILSERPNT